MIRQASRSTRTDTRVPYTTLFRSNPRLKGKLTGGDLKQLTPGSSKVAIGIRLAENLSAQVGSRISIINPAGRATPFGTVPREISYAVAAIFEDRKSHV